MVALKGSFTAENVLSVEVNEAEDGNVTLVYTIGNTDSDCGEVHFLLSDTGNEEDDLPCFDFDVEMRGESNWGTWAALSAMQVAVTHFEANYAKQYRVIDNTGIRPA